MINIDLRALERENTAIIRFYKKQLEAFGHLKKGIEKVQWADAKYDEFVFCMNEIGSALSTVFHKITNGNDVYVISQLMPLVQKYLDYESKFPII